MEISAKLFADLIEKYFDVMTGEMLSVREWETQDLVDIEVAVNGELQRRADTPGALDGVAHGGVL